MLSSRLCLFHQKSDFEIDLRIWGSQKGSLTVCLIQNYDMFKSDVVAKMSPNLANGIRRRKVFRKLYGKLIKGNGLFYDSYLSSFY